MPLPCGVTLYPSNESISVGLVPDFVVQHGEMPAGEHLLAHTLPILPQSQIIDEIAGLKSMKSIRGTPKFRTNGHGTDMEN